MRYTRMHGAGNSFVLIEDPRCALRGEDLRVLALRLCDPRRGPGADGMIVLRPPLGDEDCAMLFFNADGSSGEMCGNGARCAARYCVGHGLARDPQCVRIRATAGEVRCRRIDESLYEVRLNDPSVLEPGREAVTERGAERCAYVELGDPGIPHAVVEVTAAELADLGTLRARGRALRFCPVFPKGANVDFFCPDGEARVRAVTYERGVEDFTLACGTGCGAIAAALLSSGRLPGGALEIVMPGGTLSVTLRREEGRVCDILLTGPTAVLGEGELELV